MADHRLSQVSTASSTNSKRARAHIGPWQLGRTLGRGSSGRVRLAKHAESGRLAAVKIVPKAQIHDPQGPNEADSYGIEREVIIMKLIEHPNVMALYDVWENKGELYLVLEYIEGGELFDYLISRGRLSEREAIHYFRQICYGVAYCHRFNICHRDLKPENLLLDKNRNIKIADFGMAALETSGRLLETSCGSPHYASPEIVTGKTYHGAPSDIWSCGIILFALLTGHLPFDDDNIRQLLLKVQSGKYVMPHSLSVEARDLIARMLVVDPVERITMPEILSHPLLQKYPARHVPPENMGARMPSVDVSQPVVNIDREILRNLQTLWHRDSREVLIARLRAPGPNVEKTFYSLLLRFRQKHGLASQRGSDAALPRNRSAVSIRSLRSMRSVRSLQSGRSDHSPSARSVRSQASGRSTRSARSVRSALSTQPQRHRHIAGKRVSPRKNAGASAPSKKSAAAAAAAATARPAPVDSRGDIRTDTFAQLLDQAFNPSTLASRDQATAAQPRVTSNPVPRNYNDEAVTAGKRVVSEPVKPMLPQAPLAPLQKRQTPYDLDMELTSAVDLGAHLVSQPQFQQPQFQQPREHGQLDEQPVASEDAQNYLLPMIFEEDRFADAIEEEMELKLYKRGKLTRPQLAKADSTMGSSSSGSQKGDNSQLQISNLVPGESFFSYKPSAAAAAVTPPVRPAPRAPQGPRELPTASQRKPVPVYTDETAASASSSASAAAGAASPTSVEASTAAKSRRLSPLRKPLAPIMSEDLRNRPSTAAASTPAAPAAPAPQATVAGAGDKIVVAKKGDKDKKKSWIRRFTPRLSRSKHDEPHESTEPVAAKASASKPTQPKQPQQEPSTEKYIRARQDANANKENVLPQGKKAPAAHSTVGGSKPAATKPATTRPAATKPAKPVVAEEPKQNWFMKLLSPPNSSRTLMSTCQPIELRAMILEILKDWMPHGLSLYSNGARGEPIVVAIMRTNSLRLKTARIGIVITTGHTSTASSARLYLQRGSRTSFMTFTNEMERRLGTMGALGLAE